MPGRRATLSLTVLAALAVALVVRALRAGVAPRRELDGTGPVIGSLDTWPPVPRAPEGHRPAG